MPLFKDKKKTNKKKMNYIFKLLEFNYLEIKTLLQFHFIEIKTR